MICTFQAYNFMSSPLPHSFWQEFSMINANDMYEPIKIDILYFNIQNSKASLDYSFPNESLQNLTIEMICIYCVKKNI